MTFTNSVDEKNKPLLQELTTAGVQIEFEVRPDFQNWAVQPRSKYLIVAPNEDSNPEMLAHELLHIKMNILGFLSTPVITDIFDTYNCHFATAELSNMQNLLSHIKMIPLFVQLGYPPEKFTANYGQEFFTTQLLPSIVRVKTVFEINKNAGTKPTIELITEFLSLIICLKTYEVENNHIAKKFDTSFIESELRSMNEELFHAIYTELDNWIQSGTYKNYPLYTNINAHLAQLGYPSEAGWQSWMYS